VVVQTKSAVIIVRTAAVTDETTTVSTIATSLITTS